MTSAIAWLKGKKTYFVLSAAAVIWLLSNFGIIPADAANSAYSVLGMAGGASLAAKINRLNS